MKKPIYVRADSDIYDYYQCHGVQMITDLYLLTGEFGAQLYGRSKHNLNGPDWSDMKLVLLTHTGIIDSDIRLKCQRQLEKNKQTTNSYSNPTSWPAGKVACEKCGNTMTTIKGKPNKNGEQRRYFNCTGKSHKKTCTDPKASVYAENLEEMVYECISEKLAELKNAARSLKNSDPAEVNNLKLKLKTVEQAEQHLLDSMLAGEFNEELLALANQKAAQLKKDKLLLYERLDELKSQSEEVKTVVDMARSWNSADYSRKKEVAMVMMHKIVIYEDGSVKIEWHI